MDAARSMVEHDSDLSLEELDRLFETGKFTDTDGNWLVVE